ncbi:phosphatase and tensin-like protein isoform X2 [Musca autumnalis]
MANTLSVMTNVLRNVVSKQRIRYKEKGFNLDLAYVCDNIIAMGYPAEKYESMYRNRLEDVQKFLEENHRDHYKIYNLCLERSYDISKFHGRVSVYPFEDHNPPTIELIQKFCEDVDSWLKADPQNVAAVHCKAGKGRTGTMICCYLLYSGQQLTADDALSCYDEKRTKDRKGVTIPSQRRYVQYFSKLIRMGLSYSRRSLQFCEIRFLGANAHSQGSVHCSISVLEDKVKPLQNFVIDFRKQSVLDVKLAVSGDIKVELTKNTKKIFHFWFNTFFVADTAVIEGEGNDEKYIYTLTKWEIDDAHKDKEHKCFSEDFKVVLVFYVDGTNAVRESEKVPGNQTLPNHRQTMQSGPANSRLPSTQINNYTLPQNNSSGSEMNFICDQKSSSSTSVSSSLGATTDNSNGYESNSKRSTQQRSGVQNVSNVHHSHPYMTMHDDNSVLYSSPPPPPLTTKATPPGFVVEHDRQLTRNQCSVQKNNMHHLQQTNIPSMTATSTPNQRLVQRQNAVAIAGSNADGGGILDIHRTGTEVLCQTSAALNASGISSSTNYNHSTHNSSKTSSVSSQSSSAIGDNEEDWESGESSAKQLDHITLLLSTSTVTSSPAPIQLLPNNNTNTNLPPNDSSRNKQNINFGIQPSSSTSSSISTSTSSSTCTSASQSSLSSKSSSKCPHNKCKTSSSSCTNRVAGGDDDDDDVIENVDENKPKFKISNSNIVATQEQEQHKQGALGLTFEPNVRDSEKSRTATLVECSYPADEKALALTTPAQTPSTRPKFMHLLMLPKNTNNSHQSTHKPIFKRKSSYKLTKNVSSATGYTATNDDFPRSSGDTAHFESASAAAESVVGNIGGVATTSKQKLKIKLKKNKLKLSQKFQWFQSYFRSDPVDFCENFVQQTTSIRRNSICSMASRTHKLSTATPPSVTPPPPPLTGTNTDGSSSCEQLNDRGPGSVSGSTSNASIATGDLCEDYYSHICDNQLSFSNSPCKSPRSMADIVGSISGSGGHGGSFGSSFARSAGSFHQQYFRERRETLPGLSSHNTRRNNVVIVAAKPARTNAIGFNINAGANDEQQRQIVRQDSDDVDASPASIYNTASCSPPLSIEGVQHETKNTPFVFPVNDPNTAPDDSNCDNQCKESPTKAQTKYSLNLVIVKECPSEELPAVASGSTPKTSRTREMCDDTDSDICCDHDQNMSTILNTSSEGEILSTKETSAAIDDLFETKTTATTCASICSNSSSSGFCTSECCTTNSSSSSCNCNPFALVLERHAALAAINTTKQAVGVKNSNTPTTTNTSMSPSNVGEEAYDTKPESNDNTCD